jgi:hypothetical protein
MDVGIAWFGNHSMFSCNKSTQVWRGIYQAIGKDPLL